MSEQVLKESKQNSKMTKKSVLFPILAVDYGLKRVGIAVSDMKGVISTPLETLRVTRNKNHEIIIDELLEIADEYRVKNILVGVPQSFTENHDKAENSAAEFGRSIAEKTDIEVLYWDESFSTSDSQNVLLSLGQNVKSSKGKIDRVSAAYFLQEFLDSYHNHEL